MCDEREPLLAYVYEESDAAERRRVEAHLATCETCRDELSGLRQVREDLLAWDVPDHGSVWRPFTPVRPAWSWRDLPAWTMAAAAAIVFVVGAGGGLAASAWRASAPSARVAVVAPNAPSVPVATPVATPAAVLPADLAALEARVLREVGDRKTDADHGAHAGMTSAEYARLLSLIVEQHATVTRLTQKVNDLSTAVAQLPQAQQQPGGQQGSR
jgi:anti-sigma factor RsiW